MQLLLGGVLTVVGGTLAGCWGDRACDDQYVGYEIRPSAPSCLTVIERRPGESAYCYQPLEARFTITNRCAVPLTYEGFTVDDRGQGGSDAGAAGADAGAAPGSRAIAPGETATLAPNSYMRPNVFTLGADRYELSIRYEE